MKSNLARSAAATTCILALIASAPSFAQESVNTELDQCIQKEKLASTAKGAALGALAGLGKSLFKKDKDHKENVAKNMAIGAAAGGAIGYAVAYYQAVGKCLKKHPEWIPESKVERTKGYAQVVKESRYKPQQGIVASIRPIRLPATVKAGEKIDVHAVFIVLTPNGAETPVVIERKLFAIADGQQTELPFFGKASEERVVEPGEHVDTASIPTPADAKPGTAFRIEYLISVDKKPPVTSSATVTIG